MVHGENLIVTLNGYTIARSKTCTLNCKSNYIDIASPFSTAEEGSWECRIPSKKSWSISTDCLIASSAYASSMIENWKSQTQLSISFYDKSMDMIQYGNAYISSMRITASKGDIATMSMELGGTGMLRRTAALSQTLCKEEAFLGFVRVQGSTPYAFINGAGDNTTKLYSHLINHSQPEGYCVHFEKPCSYAIYNVTGTTQEFYQAVEGADVDGDTDNNYLKTMLFQFGQGNPLTEIITNPNDKDIVVITNSDIHFWLEYGHTIQVVS